MGKILPFHTAYGTHPKLTPNASGSKYENDYQEELDNDGRKSLIIVGKTNVYDKIQQDLESTKIENILHRVAMGDLTALNQREGRYIDCTEMPSNLMEAQNIVLRAKEEFYKLPLEVRREFENSPDVYIAELGTEEWAKKIGPYAENITKLENEKKSAEYNEKVTAQAKFEKDVELAKGATSEQK